jgi:hypothetical protein
MALKRSGHIGQGVSRHRWGSALDERGRMKLMNAGKGSHVMHL